MDAGDLELFERSLRAATQRHRGAELDAALAELGWTELLAEEPPAAITTLFELQGAANTTSASLTRVLEESLGVGPVPVLWPALGSADPPGCLRDSSVVIHGLIAGAPDAGSYLVVINTGQGTSAVEVPAGALTARPVHGMDPWLGVVEITGRLNSGAASGSVPDDGGPVDWPAARALAQLALGHELVGASRQMLELARAHALERVQFDRPIASFQAVRHRLADTLVAVETASAALDAAWEDGSEVSAGMAKALAGRGARTAARHCQQVLAGIGFTTEHVLHRYVRRVLVLDQLFGSTRSLTRALGEELLRSGRLPPLLAL